MSDTHQGRILIADDEPLFLKTTAALLRNAVERGIAMARGGVISPADLPQPIQRADIGGPSQPDVKQFAASRSDAVDDAERDYLAFLLRENSGNVAQSARQAGMSRQGLHKLLKKHGVDAREYRP